MTDIQTRLRRINEAGYETPEHDKHYRGGYVSTTKKDAELLAIIERLLDDVEHWHAEWIERGIAADMWYTIGAARLNLAEQKIANREDVMDRAIDMYEQAEQRIAELEAVPDMDRRLWQARAEKAEAALAAEREEHAKHHAAHWAAKE